MSVPGGQQRDPADNMASAKALRLHRGDSCASRNECKSNRGASEGDKSGSLKGSGGFIPEGYGSHKCASCSPNFSANAAWLGGLFPAIRKEVQP